MEGELGLAIDGRRDQGQPDDDGELHHHQRLTRLGRACRSQGSALERRRRPEGREHEGRIETGQRGREQGGADDRGDQRRIVQVVERQGPVEEGVQRRQGQFDQHGGDDHGDRDVDQRLAHELDDEVGAPGARGLAHTHLDSTPRGARGHQGDEVDRGDQHDETAFGRHAGIHPGVGGLAQRPGARTLAGGEMQIRQRLQPEAVDRCPVRTGKAHGREVGEAGAQRISRSAGLEPQIGQFRNLERRGIGVIQRQHGERRAARAEHLSMEMGVRRQVLEHRHHAHGVEACQPLEGGLQVGGRIRTQRRQFQARVDHQHLADGGVLAEVLARRRARQHQAVGRGQGRVGVTGQDRQGHDLEEIRIGPEHRFGDRDVAMLERGRVVLEPRHVFSFGEIQPEIAGGHGRRAIEPLRLLPGQLDVVLQAIDAFVAGDEAFERVFVAQEQSDEDGHGEADRQAQDGNPRVEAVAADVAKRGGDVVTEHRCAPPIRSAGRSRAWRGRPSRTGTRP